MRDISAVGYLRRTGVSRRRCAKRAPSTGLEDDLPVALATCTDCGTQVSSRAEACPSCGAPQLAECPRCGVRAVEKVDGLKGTESLAAFLLLLVMIIPGIAYYFDRTRLPYCSNCHRRALPVQARWPLAARLAVWLVLSVAFVAVVMAIGLSAKS